MQTRPYRTVRLGARLHIFTYPEDSNQISNTPVDHTDDDPTTLSQEAVEHAFPQEYWPGARMRSALLSAAVPRTSRDSACCPVRRPKPASGEFVLHLSGWTGPLSHR
jgi:hypothetical protein